MVSDKSGGRVIVSIFILIIVGIVLLSTSADTIDLSTSTTTLTNKSYTSGAVNVSVELPGIRGLSGTYEIYNATGTLVSAEGNVTLSESVTSGARSVYITVWQNGSIYNSSTMNVSGTFEPDGYVSESGSRGILNLVIIMGALAIAVSVIAGLFNKGPIAKLIYSKS